MPSLGFMVGMGLGAGATRPPDETGYRAYTRDGVPSWLRDADGLDAFHLAVGDAKDCLTERAKDAVTSRMPLLAPADALELLGGDRQLPRGPGEADDAYALRLQQAWDVWPLAGTGEGVVRALVTAGYPNALVAQQGQTWFQVDGTGALVLTMRPAGEWLTGHGPGPWSRFVVVLPPTFPWSGSTPVDGSAEARRVAALVNTWKPAHATCSAILVLSSASEVTADYYPAGWTADTQARATADTNASDATHTLWSP